MFAPGTARGAVLALQQEPSKVMGVAPQSNPSLSLQEQISEWAHQYAARALGDTSVASAPKGSATVTRDPAVRVEIEVGELDRRLRLAPCEKISAYLPSGAWLWGRTRVGMRCDRGEKRWNVFLPVTVHVWGKALVAAVALPAGSRLEAADVREVEVDLAADSSPALRDRAEALGRQLVKGVQPGDSLRQAHLRPRRWFAAGDPVELVVRGDGFVVKSEATAVSPGDEDHCSRVRTLAGQTICGQAVSEHRVEVNL